MQLKQAKTDYENTFDASRSYAAQFFKYVDTLRVWDTDVKYYFNSNL